MDQRIELVLDLMRNNLRRKLSPDKLATLVGLSPSRLHYLFKAVIGTSPAKHLRYLRLERSRYLLNTTQSSVKQVMIEVGVTDRSHFEREFKRLYGVTPSQYRKADLSHVRNSPLTFRGWLEDRSLERTRESAT